MELISLLIIFILLVAFTLYVTYAVGLAAGLMGVVFVALFLTFVENILRDFGKPNGGNTASYSLGKLARIFSRNLAIFLFCFYGVYNLITWFKTGQSNLLALMLWTLIGLALIYRGEIASFSLREYVSQRLTYRRLQRTKRLRASRKSLLDKDWRRLEAAFMAVTEKDTAQGKYFSTATKIARRSEDASVFAKAFAFYASKQIIQGLESGNPDFALATFEHYLAELLPRAGSCKYKTNLAGNALSLGIVSENQSVIDSVHEKLLGADFDILQSDNIMLVFNLGCYYALNGDKRRMLEAIAQGLKLGKSPSAYTADKDFANYYSDEDFQAALRSNDDI